MKITNILSKSPFFYTTFLNIFRRDFAFQGNRIIRDLVLRTLRDYPITSFVETGTHRGDTTYVIAKKHPNLSIFTCEADPTLYGIARRRLIDCKNVHVSMSDSVRFLKGYSQGTGVGNFPFFFLDAHGEENPLLDELAIINYYYNKAVILIDDMGEINKLEDIKPFLENHKIIGKYLLAFKGNVAQE